MKAKYIAKGLIKNIPGVEKLYNFHKATGGTISARYCYAVWMRHLVQYHKNGFHTVPEKIGELGPGDSLGIGLSALLSGSAEYHAFDVVKYTDIPTNLRVFEELVELFRNRTPIPTNDEFPKVKPVLESYDFPHHILSEAQLAGSLSPDRIAKIREAIKESESDTGTNRMISYQVPWADRDLLRENYLDMIISQAVLECVNDLPGTYSAIHSWLKPGGLMSHTIDLKCHGSADTWYGHWTYSDLQWKIVKGRKKYLINREPYSVHIRLIKALGFRILTDIKTNSEPIQRKALASRFKDFTDEDLGVSSMFVQAVK